MINRFGNIFEGIMTPDGKLNGFCVSFFGNSGHICAGFYKNDKIFGNFMQITAKTLGVHE